MQEEEILHADEELIAWFAGSGRPGRGSVTLLTDRRILVLEDGWTTSSRLREVESIEHRWEAAAGDIIDIHGRDGRQLRVVIPPGRGGELFLRELMGAWERAGEGLPLAGRTVED